MQIDPLEVNIEVKQVTTDRQLEGFIRIIEQYDSNVRDFFIQIPLPILNKQEKLFVGYKNNLPVVIEMLFVDGDAGGIFILITKEKHGTGYGTAMMR